jgi:hypothetical protein
MEQRYTIYGHIDPRDGQLRYVGMVSSRSATARLGEHISAALRGSRTHHHKWLRSLLSVGLTPDIEVLDVCNSIEALVELEKWHIAYFRFIGCDLTNHTDGGEGVPGHRDSPETKLKKSVARKGCVVSAITRAKLSVANLGKKQSLETIQKRVLSLRGQKRSAEDRAKMSARQTGKIVSPETRLKISASRLGCPVSVASRIRMSRAWGTAAFKDQNGVIYQTQSEAGRALGLRPQNIGKVLRHKRNHTGGYTFKYVEEHK